MSECPYCSSETSKVYHVGCHCPQVKAINYYPNGQVQRVEFIDHQPEGSGTLTIKDTTKEVAA